MDELVEKRPQIVRNCSLFIIWPPSEDPDNNYDIEAIRKLRPRAVLTVYECVGGSGSVEVRIFLRSNDSYKLSNEEYGVDNYDGDKEMREHGGCAETNCGVPDAYTIEEKAIQKVHYGVKYGILGTRVYRMVILRRTDKNISV